MTFLNIQTFTSLIFRPSSGETLVSKVARSDRADIDNCITAGLRCAPSDAMPGTGHGKLSVYGGNPFWCLPSNSAQEVAQVMCDQNVGSIPVVMDQESRKLVGMITDRDLCCSVIAEGLDAKVIASEKFVTLNPVTCRDAENIEKLRTRNARTPDQAHPDRRP